ncbi:hypothetical protein [Streptomyces axinellae]|uniref:Secreted protein n=1 Tax=Streptomyces axinellae TaxID=552788 RepID=A0ABN3QX75_9ACTN
MRRSVNAVRACGYLVALVLTLLLAVGNTGAHQAWAADRPGPVTQEGVIPLAGQGEHGEDDCHTRRTPHATRTLAGPSPSGPHQRILDCRRPAAGTGPNTGPLPETGSAGMPWRRSVEVSVLNQVFRH